MQTSFPDLETTSTPDGTALRGSVADDAALHGILERCRDLHVEIISLRRIEHPAVG